MKTILFDLLTSQPEGKSKFHGGGGYIQTIFKCIVESYRYNTEYKFIFYYDKNKFMESWVLEELKNSNAIVYADIEKPVMIEKIFKENEVDVFFSGLAINYDGSMIPKNVKKVGTIHGLRSIEMPIDRYSYKYYSGFFSIQLFLMYRIRKLFELFQQRKVEKFQKKIEYLDEIICVSNHTRYAILEEFPKAQREKIHVFYSPVKYMGRELLCNTVQKTVMDKFILMLGGNRWVKNIYRGILALDRLFSKGKLEDYKVYIIGKIPPKVEKVITNKDRFVIYDYLDENELEQLYQACDIFFYPTLNEGFGIPPEEVMRYGKTCVVSGITSLTEVYGDAVYYVNPYDIGEMSKRILQASAEKIPIERIEERMKYLIEKQEKELVELCEFIVRT